MITLFRRPRGTPVATGICMLAVSSAMAQGGGDARQVAEFYESILRQWRSLDEELMVTWTCKVEADPGVVSAGWLEGTSIASKGTAARLGRKRFITFQDVLMRNGVQMGNDLTATYNQTDCRLRVGKEFRIQKEKSSSTELNVYLNSISWPAAPEEISFTGGNSDTKYFIPFCLKVGQWRALSEPEFINSTSCTVVENEQGTQRMWLDPSRGFVPARRIVKAPLENIRQRITDFLDYKQVKPGVYLPRRVENRLEYIRPSAPGIAGSSRTVVVATQLVLSGVNADLFTLQPFAGELVVDSIRNVDYISTARTDNTLEDSVAAAVLKQRRVLDSSRRHWLLPAGLVVANVLLCIVIVKRRYSV